MQDRAFVRTALRNGDTARELFLEPGARTYQLPFSRQNGGNDDGQKAGTTGRRSW